MKIVIKLPKLKPTFMPVTKGNRVFKSKKTYSRKKKHKKDLE
jgi:hypothetical protein